MVAPLKVTLPKPCEPILIPLVVFFTILMPAGPFLPMLIAYTDISRFSVWKERPNRLYSRFRESTLLQKVICVNTILRSLDFRCAKYCFLRRLTPGPPGSSDSAPTPPFEVEPKAREVLVGNEYPARPKGPRRPFPANVRVQTQVTVQDVQMAATVPPSPRKGCNESPTIRTERIRYHRHFWGVKG
jgi:hypothetical protein